MLPVNVRTCHPPLTDDAGRIEAALYGDRFAADVAAHGMADHHMQAF